MNRSVWLKLNGGRGYIIIGARRFILYWGEVSTQEVKIPGSDTVSVRSGEFTSPHGGVKPPLHPYKIQPAPERFVILPARGRILHLNKCVGMEPVRSADWNLSE